MKSRDVNNSYAFHGGSREKLDVGMLSRDVGCDGRVERSGPYGSTAMRRAGSMESLISVKTDDDDSHDLRKLMGGRGSFTPTPRRRSHSSGESLLVACLCFCFVYMLLFVSLSFSLCLSACQFVCLSVCLSVCLCINCLSVCHLFLTSSYHTLQQTKTLIYIYIYIYIYLSVCLSVCQDIFSYISTITV